MSEPEVLEKTCRICLYYDNTMFNVFDEVQTYNLKIADMIYTYGGIIIEENDEYSKSICEECIREMIMAAKFREKCQQSDEKLKVIKKYVTVEDTMDDNDTITDDYSSYNFNKINIKKESSNSISDIEETIECVEEKDMDYEEVEYLDGEIDENIEYIILENEENCSENNDNLEKESDYNFSSSIEKIDVEELTYDPEMEDTSIIVNEKSKKKNNDSKYSKVKLSTVINFNCEECGAGFAHYKNLARHLKSHKSLNVVSCPICSIVLNTPSSLAEHMINHEETIIRKENGKMDKKLHYCSYCKKSCCSKSALISHIRVHTGEKPFNCQECKKSFTTLGGLELHARRHSGVKPFKCEYCPRDFVESSNLKVHLRIHTGEKPHKCTMCGKSFSRVFLLQIHQRTHTGEKPYTCNVCKKSFAQQGDLAAHKRIHTGERPHTCKICNKGFIKSGGLYQHMRTHSKEKSLLEYTIDQPQVIKYDEEQIEIE